LRVEGGFATVEAVEGFEGALAAVIGFDHS
jgi:hypothetical protein